MNLACSDINPSDNTGTQTTALSGAGGRCSTWRWILPAVLLLLVLPLGARYASAQQVPQRGTASIYATATHTPPGPKKNRPQKIEWDILLDGAVVATSATPNGWSLKWDSPLFMVSAPQSAQVSANYEVRYRPEYRSAYLGVIARVGVGKTSAGANGAPQVDGGGGGGVYLTAITLNPTSVTGGTASAGTATLSGVAPTGGAVVTLSSNNTAATVTSSVTVPAGQTSATFTVSTGTVSTVQTATITGNYNAQQTATLTVTPVGYSVDVAKVTLVPGGVTGGSGSTGTVTLTSAAAGNTAVRLSSSNTAVATTPATVTVYSGQTTASFSISTTPVPNQTPVTITATLTSSQYAILTVFPPQLDNTNGVGIQISPNNTTGGTTVTGIIRLTGPAYTGGCPVVVDTDHDTAVETQSGGSFPTTITVPAGQSSTTFNILTSRVNRVTVVTFTATFAGVSVQDTLTLNPANIRVTDLAPGLVDLKWDCHATGNFIITRTDLSVPPTSINPPYITQIASLPNTTTSFVDKTLQLYIVPAGPPPLGYTILTSSHTGVNGNLNGTGTIYTIYDSNNPGVPLSMDNVSLYLATASANQTVDSRIDPRVPTVQYIDHNFGTTTYRGGLFVGFEGDGAKVGRSFLQLTFDRADLLTFNNGTNRTFRCGDIVAYCTMAYTTQNQSQKVNVSLCPTTGSWDPTTLVWTNSQNLTIGAKQTIQVNYTPVTEPGYQLWPNSDALIAEYNYVMGPVSHDVLGYALVAPDETVYGWLYFAKTNFIDPAIGSAPACYGYAADLPVPLSLQFSPSPVVRGNTVTGTVTVNGVGAGDSVIVGLSSTPVINGLPAWVTVTGFNQNFTFTAPSTPGTYTISASANGVTVSKTLTVQ